MTPPRAGAAGLRARQLAALARPAMRATTWPPTAIAMGVGFGLVVLGSRAGVATRLGLASAAVAAGAAFVLDDPAAATLGPSPTSLPARRRMRVGSVVLAVGLWWVAAAAIASSRVPALPWRAMTLELTVLVAVALAVSAAAATSGDRTGGGVAGAVVVAGCSFGTFLPSRWWVPLPADTTSPGASARWVTMLVLAVAVLVAASRDPA